LNNQKVIFRADGNSTIGLGHFFRVLALAELIKDKFDAHIAFSAPDYFVKAQVDKAGIKLISLPAVDYEIRWKDPSKYHLPFDLNSVLTGTEIVVLDGYLFDNDYQQKIKEKGCILLCIDDIYKDYPFADAIINHALSAGAKMYKNTKAKIHAGPDYSLMRREFLDESKKEKVKYKFDTVFVCFGGADTEELAFKIASIVSDNDNGVHAIHVLNSSSYSGNLSKFQEVSAQSGKKIFLHQNLNASQIIALMNSCDFAIISASNTAYECACAKLPMIVGYYVEHQMGFYNALITRPNIVGISEWQNIMDGELINAMNSLIKNYKPDAPAFIDGFQQQRFLNIFASFSFDTKQ